MDTSQAEIPYLCENCKYKDEYMQDGDIIIADTAEDYTAGKCTELFNVGTSKIISGLHTIPCRPKIKFAQKYLGYYTNSPAYRHQLLSLLQGIKVYSISKTNLSNTHVSYPPLPEQQKIADFLSLVDQRIEKQRQLIESLKKYKRGALSRIFNDIEDWEKSEAKDIATIETGCSNTQDNNPNGLYPFYIRSANIARSDKYIFDGEAVLTIGDGQIGKVYHYINGKFDCHQRVYMITKFKKISGRYFYHFFSTFFYNRAIKMSAKNTVDSVRMDMIAQMPIYFPDKEKQEQIVSTLDTIDRFINKQTELLEQMTSLKKGFLQQMFI